MEHNTLSFSLTINFLYFLESIFFSDHNCASSLSLYLFVPLPMPLKPLNAVIDHAGSSSPSCTQHINSTEMIIGRRRKRMIRKILLDEQK